MLARIARYGKWAGRGYFMFSAALGADEVYDTYKEGGDAFKKAVGVSFDLMAIRGIGNILLDFTPAGWVTLVGLSIVEALLFTGIANSFLEHKGEQLAGGIEDCYEWLKTDLSYWL